MSLKPAQKSQLPGELDTIYNILPTTIRSAIPGPRYQIASQFPTTKNPLKLFKFASTESHRLSLGFNPLQTKYINSPDLQLF